MLQRIAGCFVLLAAALAASAQTSTTVSDVATARGTIRIAHYRAANPLANLFVMSGGFGQLGLQASGSGTHENFTFSPFIRIRQALLDAGYSLVMIDVPSDMTGRHSVRPSRDRGAFGEAPRGDPLRPGARQRAAWMLGFSAGGPSAANVALAAPRSQPFGLILLSPNTGVAPHLLGMNLEAMQRPTLLLTHASDTCEGTSPSNAPTVLSRLSATEARRHVSFTGGSAGSRGGGCDTTGFH